MTITDEAVEAHARAMCRAMGLDPDGQQPDYETGWVKPTWTLYAREARLSLASRAAEAELAATPAATRP